MGGSFRKDALVPPFMVKVHTRCITVILLFASAALPGGNGASAQTLRIPAAATAPQDTIGPEGAKRNEYDRSGATPKG